MRISYCVGSVIAAALVAAGTNVAAQTGERLSDDEVKAIILQVDTGRDKFEGNLDGSFKGSTVQGPNGVTRVSVALQDYQDSTKNLQHRFAHDYAGNSEAATILKQSMQIDQFMKGPASPTKGRNEWERQTMYLKRLAAAYGTTFPLPDGATVRRVNDQEAAGFAGAVATQAEQIKNVAKSDSTLDKPVRKALMKDVDAVMKQARTLQSRLKDGKPSTADARSLKTKVLALTGEGRQLPADVLTAIGGLRAPLEKLDQAFGVVPTS